MNTKRLVVAGTFAALLVGIIAIVMLLLRRPPGAEYFGSTSDDRRTYDMKMLVAFAGEVTGLAIVSNRGIESISGKNYYKIVTTFEGIPGAQQETAFLRFGEDGIYSRTSSTGDETESLEIPFPPTVGRTWSYKSRDMNIDMRVAAVEDFDTSKKTFKKCLKIVGVGQKGVDHIEMTSYYAPKVGLVSSSMKFAGVAIDMKLRE